MYENNNTAMTQQANAPFVLPSMAAAQSDFSDADLLDDMDGVSTTSRVFGSTSFIIAVPAFC